MPVGCLSIAEFYPTQQLQFDLKLSFRDFGGTLLQK